MAANPVDLHVVAQQAAREYGLGDWFPRQIGQESGFQVAPSGRGPNGQILPNSSGASGVAQVVARYHPDAPPASDPVGQIRWMARYMAGLVKQYGGSVPKALSVYNSGQPDKYLDPSFAKGQTYNYVRNILGGHTPAATPVPTAAPTLPSLAAPAGAPAVPPPRGLSSALTAAVDTGNQMFGLPPLPTQLLSPVAPAAAPTLAPPAARTLPIPPGPGVGQGTPISGIAKTALTQIGIPYQWGGQAKLGSRTDCSGLLQASARANGVNIGRTTYEQWKQGTAVPLNQLRPGDAVFFHPGPKGPEHVAIYIGNGRIVEDPHTGASVHISALAGRGPMGARRY